MASTSPTQWLLSRNTLRNFVSTILLSDDTIAGFLLLCAINMLPEN